MSSKIYHVTYMEIISGPNPCLPCPTCPLTTADHTRVSLEMSAEKMRKVPRWQSRRRQQQQLHHHQQQPQQQQSPILWGEFCFPNCRERAAVVPSLDIVSTEENAPSSPGWGRWAAPVLLDIKEQGARGRQPPLFTLPPSVDQTLCASLELSILTILANNQEMKQVHSTLFCSKFLKPGEVDPFRRDTKTLCLYCLRKYFC